MSVLTMCKYCGCCSANPGDGPGCIGTGAGGSHDGREWLMFSRFWEMSSPKSRAWMLATECRGWWLIDPLIHSLRVVQGTARQK